MLTIQGINVKCNIRPTCKFGIVGEYTNYFYCVTGLLNLKFCF